MKEEIIITIAIKKISIGKAVGSDIHPLNRLGDLLKQNPWTKYTEAERCSWNFRRHQFLSIECSEQRIIIGFISHATKMSLEIIQKRIQIQDWQYYYYWWRPTIASEETGEGSMEMYLLFTSLSTHLECLSTERTKRSINEKFLSAYISH